MTDFWVKVRDWVERKDEKIILSILLNPGSGRWEHIPHRILSFLVYQPIYRLAVSKVGISLRTEITEGLAKEIADDIDAALIRDLDRLHS